MINNHPICNIIILLYVHVVSVLQHVILTEFLEKNHEIPVSRIKIVMTNDFVIWILCDWDF